MSTLTKEKGPRIKRVFRNIYDFVHLWAHQSQDEARSSNAYFEGDTIYSYGRHFPIARIYVHPKTKDKVVFFTNRTYSNTTAKHISAVRGSVSHMDKLYMENVITGVPTKHDHENNIKAWKYELEQLFEKYAKARKKELYIGKIRAVAAEMKKYIEFFGFKPDKSLKDLIDETNSENFEAYLTSEKKRIARDNKKAEKAQQEAMEKARQEFMERLEKWRTGESDRIYGRPFDQDYLRYNSCKKRVETSQGVQVPEQAARKFYNHIRAVLHNGGCVTEETCMYKIVEYEVREITNLHIRIGCHRIMMEEVEAMAKQLNWI